MNLLEAYELYENDKRFEGYKETTLEGYRWQNEKMYEYFGNKPVDEIMVFDLKRFLNEKYGHLKPSSLGARIRFIRSFFRYLSDEGICKSNVSTKLKEPKEGSRIPKYYNKEEVELLREACKIPLEHALLEFFYSTGCRVGEVEKLNVGDINWENRSCFVIGKGDKQREVYFSIKAKIWMQWYLNARSDADENVLNESPLFVTQRRPFRRLSIDMIRIVFKRIGRGANIDIHPHRWRHTFATHMIDNGAPLEGVQDLLGHVKIETTKIYCQLSGARRKSIHSSYFN